MEVRIRGQMTIADIRQALRIGSRSGAPLWQGSAPAGRRPIPTTVTFRKWHREAVDLNQPHRVPRGNIPRQRSLILVGSKIQDSGTESLRTHRWRAQS